MTLHFHKYQGTGNDFIIIDNRSGQYRDLPVEKLCHPKFGIGADGLMLLQNSDAYDFEMVYYNSDGKLSTMCGNGGRCLVDFAKKAGVFASSATTFIAADGPHKATWTPEQVSLKMADVSHIEHSGGHYVLNTGSPHYVMFVEDADHFDMVSEGRRIRYSEPYRQEGINVNAVQVTDSQTIKVRTYERGVENETLSCGTGVTACAVAYAASHPDTPDTIKIITPGGQLAVSFKKEGANFYDIWLTGPATKVFEGSIDL